MSHTKFKGLHGLYLVVGTAIFLGLIALGIVVWFWGFALGLSGWPIYLAYVALWAAYIKYAKKVEVFFANEAQKLLARQSRVI
ncbi:TPA: hypothetical protein ACF3I9_004389 [Klebsiella aerogenes]